MYLFKRGKTYWFELVYNGQRFRKSTRATTRRAAEDIAAAFRTALAKGEVGILERKRSPNFKAAVADFLRWSQLEHRAHPSTADRYKHSSIALSRFFGDMPLDKITAQDVERFKIARSAEDGSQTGRRLRPATVNRELACLKAIFNHEIKGDVAIANPVRRVKFLAEENQQSRVLSFREQHQYLAAATPTLRDVALLMLETGMRPEEVFPLKRHDVNLGEAYLTVQRGKTPAARRRVPLTRAALSVLRTRIEEEGSLFLFPHTNDSNRPLPNVHGAHHRALHASAVKPFRLYDCRHTWATRAAEEGTDPVTLAAMLGHSRIQMVLRYAHPQQAHQSSAMERIEAFNAIRESAEVGTARIQ